MQRNINLKPTPITLKVGDRLYQVQYGHIKDVQTIASVTAHLAYVRSNCKFRVDQPDATKIPRIEKERFELNWEIETPYLKALYERQRLISAAGSYRLELLTDDALKAIIAIYRDPKCQKRF